MPEIKSIGDYYVISPEGQLVNSARLEYIREPWLQAVNAVKAAYLGQYGANIQSIYMRGSVALGRAIQDFSDLDSFALLRPVLPKTLDQKLGGLLFKILVSR